MGVDKNIARATANEAKIKAQESELIVVDTILGVIMYEARQGKYRVTIDDSYGIALHILANKLRELDFKVTSGQQYNEQYLEISWE